jgi:hypothetical protein
MVSVAYTHRIICDSSFIKWLLEQDDKHTLFSYLMHIKSSSEQWKKYHNLILSSEIKLNKTSVSIDENKIGAICKICEDPDFLKNYQDQKTKNLIFTIELTDERPFKCYLLTSPENESSYRENKHYNGITSVQIVSGDKARKIISDFFLAFDTERQLSR